MNKNMTQEEIDREFIKTENKYNLSYEEAKGVSIDALHDFKWELDLINLPWNCCKEDNHHLLKKLIELDANVNTKDLVFGDNILMQACSHNSFDCARLLIDKGANVNMKNNFGETALQKACQNNSYECAKLLIESGIDINSKNIFGRTALAITKVHNDNKKIVDLLIQKEAHE